MIVSSSCLVDEGIEKEWLERGIAILAWATTDWLCGLTIVQQNGNDELDVIYTLQP